MNIPVLCLHGALGSASSFKKIKEAAADALHLHVYEFGGHGQNLNMPEEFSTEFFAEEVRQQIESSGLGKVAIFGHSLGGYIGLYLAAKYPQLVDRVFTFGTKMNWTEDFAKNESAALDPGLIKEKNPKLQAYLSSAHKNWEELSSKIGAYMNSLPASTDLDPNVLGSIACPVRISVGDRDHMVTIEETWSTYKKIPNAQMQVFPGTYHAVERLSPQFFLEAMFDFLKLETKVTV